MIKVAYTKFWQPDKQPDKRNIKRSNDFRLWHIVLWLFKSKNVRYFGQLDGDKIISASYDEIFYSKDFAFLPKS